MGDDPIIPGVSNNSSAHGIQINNIGRTSLILLAVFAGLAVGISLGAVGFVVSKNTDLKDQMRVNERETRMLEYYVNRTDALLVQEGLKKAGDDFQSFKQSQSKE